MEKRKRPWGVFWQQDGKRKSKYFETEKAQISFATKLERMFKGDESKFISGDEYRDWQKFKDATHGIDLDVLIDCWNRFGQGDGGEIIGNVIPRFKEEKFAMRISADMRTQYKNHLRRFNDAFRARRMDLVTPADLFDWIHSLPYAPVTKKNHRKTIRALYNWAQARGICRTNPAILVADEKEERDIEVMTVEDGSTLFEANKNSKAIGRLALEAFGMLRYTSAKRLVFSDINWTEKGITLPASKLKTGRRTYIDGHSDNLWQWLDYAPTECWSMSERNYQEEKCRMFSRAGVRHPHNVLRHSACTYHYAAYKNPGLTAALMAHTNLRTMEQFYRGRATQADGLRWFNIRPQ